MGPRLAVRAVILREGRLLLVNAYPGRASDLWCAPGGGVERGTSLSANLIREVREEVGIAVTVGAPCLVNEFHDPKSGFHQVEVFFRCEISGPVPETWTDPEGVVNRSCWVTAAELAQLRVKPDSLAQVAWSKGIWVDPLEQIVT